MLNYCLYYNSAGVLLAWRLTTDKPNRASITVPRASFVSELQRKKVRGDITVEEERLDPEGFQKIKDMLDGKVEIPEPVIYATASAADEIDNTYESEEISL